MQLMRVTKNHIAGSKRILIYFMTGNPGLIEYYETFFNTLSSLLSESPTIFTVFGEDLAGFSKADSSIPVRDRPYGLQDQIDYIHKSLNNQISSSRDGPYESVILIGHSVGSYILLEILKKFGDDQKRDKSSSSATMIKGGILLFPTVTHIAQSPSGLILTKFLKIPGFERIIQSLATYALGSLPLSFLEKLVRMTTGMPNHAATVTTEFLRSPMGVWQALHMARDEMTTINEDKWEDDIWGIENPNPKKSIPNLYFYFGQNDHWVADHTRDALIKAKSEANGAIAPSSKPKMMIDQDKIPHSFCIKHSEIVAEKVNVWIRQIIDKR